MVLLALLKSSSLRTSEALLAAHAAGSKNAFSNLIQRYRAPVYTYLYRCGIPSPQCEDVFQEIFIKLHRSAHCFDVSRPFDPWFFAIVANTARTFFRANSNDCANHNMDEIAGDDAIDAFDQLSATETAAWLQDCIVRLPLAQREVLLLHCILDYPQEEVANMLGKPRSTVKTLLRRARQKLAKALERRNQQALREASL